MKEVKPLRMEDLTLEQKIGMVCMGSTNNRDTEPDFDYAMKLVEKRALGTMWVMPTEDGKHKESIRRISEAADYPILIACDMEGGYPGRAVGNQMALAYNCNPDDTFRFARAFGAMARADGFNTICGPILERARPDVNRMRSLHRMFGDDKEVIVKQATAFIKGLREAGIYSVAKHYPSFYSPTDSHLQESQCMLTEEELLADNLYPYLRLLEQGLLDGLMTAHVRLPQIDPDYPTTLSAKVTGILRQKGFDGIYMTDDLSMMGIQAKYGKERYELAFKGGHDILLAYSTMTKECVPAMMEAFQKGVFTEDQLNASVARILKVQERIAQMPRYTVLTDEDHAISDKINRNSIAVITDEGVSPTLSTEGRHLFVIMTEYALTPDSEPYGNVGWFRPKEISARIRKLFPHSGIMTYQQFPDREETMNLLHENLKYDDVVFVGYINSQCYQGDDYFTSRMLTTMRSLQFTNRISTFLFFGIPFVLETVPHIPRIITGAPGSATAVSDGLDALAGVYTPTGKIPYKLDLQ